MLAIVSGSSCENQKTLKVNHCLFLAVSCHHLKSFSISFPEINVASSLLASLSMRSSAFVEGES
jgi:hypothetical protein